ncbi:hypothetical protein [Rickettsiella endosymbiont of Dermanyssus gallinae]|uniref:hypothetical protein n=1 Tax=Rickettsiella endosymbiont of Dermanyssus gallinae TaxID=2856608 RepID=UPI001C52E72D|nr:hypothetical protein [Rickettsiella endosymbiont of Dermanyssus gallinae]
MPNEFQIFVEKMIDNTKRQKQFLYAAIVQDFLNFLGIPFPTEKQRRVVENLVYGRYIYDDFTYHSPLSLMQHKYLYLASEGYSLEYTAAILARSPRQLENIRAELFKILNCRNIPHCVKKGMEKKLIF